MLIHAINSAVRATETYSNEQTKANAYKALCRLRTAGVRVILEYNEARARFHASGEVHHVDSDGVEI